MKAVVLQKSDMLNQTVGPTRLRTRHEACDKSRALLH
jgi:hypothetical protein